MTARKKIFILLNHQYCRDYNQILIYVVLVKNINDLQQLGVCLTEMASSRHDTFAIGGFFNKLIYDYYMLYPSEGLISKLLIMDFLWISERPITREENSKILFKTKLIMNSGENSAQDEDPVVSSKINKILNGEEAIKAVSQFTKHYL